MKKKIGNSNVLYLTPVTIVGALSEGKVDLGQGKTTAL